MEQLLLALALFIGMIASWLLLPGGAPGRVRREETEALSHSPA